MVVTENTNLNCTLEITKADSTKHPVVVVNSNLIENSNNFNLSFSIIDDNYLSSNVLDLQAQMNDFMVVLRTKMKELGYKITI